MRLRQSAGGDLRLGDPADRRVETDDGHATAAVRRVGGDDSIAGRDQGAAADELTAERRDVGGVVRDVREERGQRRRGHVDGGPGR